jgi:hypothetical protein
LRQIAAEIPEEFCRESDSPWPSGQLNSVQQAEHDISAAIPSRLAAAPGVSHSVLEETPRTTHTGVSGPSFLGLNDDNSSEYEDLLSEEPQSHFGRNVAIAVMFLALFVVVLQWRSIRTYGMTYVHSGSAQTASRDVSKTSALPDAVKNRRDREQASLTSTGVPPVDPDPIPAATEPNADAPQPIKHDTDATNSVLAANRASAVKPEDSSPATAAYAAQPPQPASMSTHSADAPASVAENPWPAPSTVKPPSFHALPSPASLSTAGSAEMRRAANAGDSEARAAWLWRAVGKGNPQAPVELARMYEHGDGVVRSCNQAELLLRAAASRGNQQAKLTLQQMRFHGGCPPQ